jgi:carboxy-terminal domain RNA polymerase II polypeptide A small phosphatase
VVVRTATGQRMSGPLLVVFDLDETLIHGTNAIAEELADFMSGPHRCRYRPHALDLVGECLDRYDVGVWTSAGEGHAANVVDAVFGSSANLRFVWSNSRCTKTRDCETDEIVWIKDLSKLKKLGHNLDRVVAIDDSPEKHARNFGNLLRVQPWTGDQDDTELLDVGRYLEWLDHQPSVRKVEKRGWRNLTHWQQ